MFELALVLGSLHFEGHYDNRTPGVLVSHVESRITAGIVRNSYGDTSIVLSKRVLEYGIGSINAGVITGYSSSPVLPFISANIEVTPNLTLSYIPPHPTRGKYGNFVFIVNF